LTPRVVADKVQRVSGLTALRRHGRRWRDRLLASPGFQRWSLRCPLTRPIARRQARALFDVCAGFVYSQVLYACVRLELFRRLADGPRSVDELAESTGVPAAEMRRLLQAAAGLDLVEHRDEADYGLGPLGAALRGNPAIAAMVDHHHLLYADLVDPLSLLRGEMEQTHLGRYWGYAGHASPAQLDSSEVASYTGLMAASQSLIADQVIEAVALNRHRHLLDIGGGDARLAIAALRRCPELQATVVDLPAVARAAEQGLTDAGLDERADAVGADFFHDRLPSGADLVALVRVLHDHDDAAVEALLERVRAIMPDDGELVIAEPMVTDERDAARVAAYFDLYLLAMGQGRPRRPDELAAILRRAGFDEPRLARSSWPMLVRIMRARPGSGP